MQRCWDQDPHLRPGASEALQVLLAMTEGRCPPHLTHPIFVDNLWTSMQCHWDPAPHLSTEALKTVQVPVNLLVFQ